MLRHQLGYNSGVDTSTGIPTVAPTISVPLNGPIPSITIGPSSHTPPHTCTHTSPIPYAHRTPRTLR
eukprot:NODE_7389_length_321_cov_179.257353_g6652_i0.p1 GENE.NODE_7389_length_321_cov_179.257353_g6652_i0~~NODE_7389_length_321_cov_179.257353_g6652_i0.p1  ORF type:complete len:67 (-),score=9.36 NODE_7389_length_321_cov_179.257353_g6652_i0:3-203(-)